MDDKTKIKILEQKLRIAGEWMKKEVEKDKINIGSGKKTIKKVDSSSYILDKINEFFPEVALINVNEDFFDNMISSELSFLNLKENTHLDGSSVIMGYHKILDTLIESCITKNYRKFAIKSKVVLRENDPLEKTLHLVVTKGYIIGLGRLFGILEKIKKKEKTFEYVTCFSSYLDKYPYIKDMLLNNEFYNNFEKLIKTEIFGKKRHSGMITIEEVKKVRKILLGDFKDTNSVIYKLVELKNTL